MHPLWIVLLATSCSIAPAIANPRVTSPAKHQLIPGAPLQVRVYVRSATPPAALRQALQRTVRILEAAGLEPSFLVCNQRELPLLPACDSPFAHREIAVRILPQPMRNDGALGYALPSAEGKIGRYVSIFAQGVSTAAAKAQTVLEGELLGHVIAHEIGHLLLGHGAHSRRGLMRADWSLTDLARMNNSGLWFTPKEVAHLQAALH